MNHDPAQHKRLKEFAEGMIGYIERRAETEGDIKKVPVNSAYVYDGLRFALTGIEVEPWTAGTKNYDSEHADLPTCMFVGENESGDTERCIRREGHPPPHVGMGSDLLDEEQG